MFNVLFNLFVFFYSPFLLITGINILFPSMNIDLNAKTYCAAFVIIYVLTNDPIQNMIDPIQNMIDLYNERNRGL